MYVPTNHGKMNLFINWNLHRHCYIISLSTNVIMTNVRIVYAKLIDSRGATVCKYKYISIYNLPTYVLGNSLSFQEHLKAW